MSFQGPWPFFKIHERHMLVKGKLSKVHIALRFNAEAAVDLLAPLALSSESQVANECDGIVSATIIAIDELDDAPKSNGHDGANL